MHIQESTKMYAIHAHKKYFSWELSDFIKNALICVPKMNKGLTGLEQHEWVVNYIVFIFGWTIPLRFLLDIYCNMTVTSYVKLRNANSCVWIQSLMLTYGIHYKVN